MIRNKSSAMLGAVAVLICAVLLAAKPETSPLSRFTPEERKQLEAGEVVFHYILNEDQEDGIGHGEAFVLINRPARVCYDEMVKFELKDQYFPRLVKSTIEKADGNKVWVHEVLDFEIMKLEYVTLMVKRDKILRVDYRLDPSYPHDISGFEGYYFFEKVDEKSALLTYIVTSVDVGLPVPDFIMKALSSRDLPGIAANVKKRFESDGKWKKP